MICPRCREESSKYVTSAYLCLPCVIYLTEEGGKWSSGDDVYLLAIREWVEEKGSQFAALI
jgi:hypothetical protein